MITTLIRTVNGQETPAPGRWTIAPGYPVDCRAGRWWHRTRPTLRTRAGFLLVAPDGGLTFQIAFDATDLLGSGATPLIYQSLSIVATPVAGQWAVDGELFARGRVIPARSALFYHGVFRTGGTAIARIGWYLRPLAMPNRDVQNRDAPGSVPLSATADVNAEAPPALLETKVCR